MVKNTKLNHVVIVNIEQEKSNLCLFFQADSTNLVISYETVKAASLLAYTVIIQYMKEFNKKIYIQLKYFEPITEFQVEYEDNHPNFMKKLVELIGRLAFGSVGGKYGGGLGFLDFALKLNRYRQYELSNWKKYLNEGNMIYI